MRVVLSNPNIGSKLYHTVSQPPTSGSRRGSVPKRMVGLRPMKLRPTTFHFLAFAAILYFVSACSQATPIVILVAPTQQSSPTPQVAEQATITVAPFSNPVTTS